MKARTTSIFILLALLWLLPTKSLAAANDTLNYAFLEGRIEILSGEGELYPFAHDLYGYKTIYYLFTMEDYLHLDTTDITDGSSYYCFMEETPQADWYNSETKGTARDDVKWPLKYTGKDYKDTECVKNNPHRFMRRRGNEAPIQLLFNADGNRQKKVDGTTVLLVVMPPLKDKIDSKRYARGFKVNYGGYNGKEPKDYCNEVTLTKKDTVLGDLEYVIGCYDRALIDYVTANGVLIPVKDSMFGKKDVVVPLKAIPITYDKPVAIDIHYRYFGDNGEITSHKDSRTLSLHWKKTSVPVGALVLIILGILVLIVLISGVMSRFMAKSTSPQRPVETDGHEKKPLGGKQQHDSGQGEETQGGSENNEPKNEDAEKGGEKHGFWGLLSRKSKDQPGQTLEAQIKSLQKSMEQKEKELQEMNRQLTESTTKLKKAQADLQTAQTNADKNLAAIQAQHKDALKTQEKQWKDKVKLAQDAQKEAETAKDHAKEDAKKEFDQQKTKLESECKTKVEAAENNARTAQTEAERKIKGIQDQCNASLERWTGDRKAILEQLKANVNYLTTVTGQMPTSAFKGHCEKISKGAAHYEEDLGKRIESYVGDDLTIGQCLEKERKEVCRILDSGSNSWMNLLGRLYSYLSVDALRQQLTMEGVSAELVTDAFETMQTVLASLGIVVLNCSLGYDSGNNPNMARLFEPKSSVDLITEWLGGNDAVEKAIPKDRQPKDGQSKDGQPKNWQIVYDFGQLAYLSTEDHIVHPGIVIYYNS